MSRSSNITFRKRTYLRLSLVSASVDEDFSAPTDNHLERSIDSNEGQICEWFCFHKEGIQNQPIKGDIVDCMGTPWDKRLGMNTKYICHN